MNKARKLFEEEIQAFTECSAEEMQSLLQKDKDDSEAVNRFLEGRTPAARKVFLRRYWFGDSVREIAEAYDMGESHVKMTLLRTRNALRDFLTTEGVTI